MTAAPYLKNALPDAQPAGGNPTLTYAAALNVDLSVNNFMSSVTLTGNVSGLTFTNGIEGVTYYLEVIQDGTGSRTVAKGTGTLFAGGSLSLSSSASEVDILGILFDGTNYNVWIVGKNFS